MVQNSVHTREIKQATINALNSQRLPQIVERPTECLFRDPIYIATSILTTDASLVGWGAHLDNHKISGKWSPTESTLHINLLEFRAVRNACAHFLLLIKGKQKS